MSYQILDIGSAPNAKDGESLRSAARKINENFSVIFGSSDAIFVTQFQNFNAQIYTTYEVDTRNGPITATLPSTPRKGSVITFVDGFGTFGTNNFIVNTNNKKILGTVVAQKTYNQNFTVKKFIFINDTIGWIEE